MESIKLYIKESYNELINKVTWPSWASLQSSTILVIVSTLILAAVIAVMDLASKGFTEFIYRINS
ncbi:MAG: preprotein translocase subunit SecE [Lewinellaceae bacterium]|nr:preprotein translocase subunit SecE [Lewinellaceae bacterium]MCB9285377.1 preprotein translocase subunit SecE [Lewinellaceae bacterium]